MPVGTDARILSARRQSEDRFAHRTGIANKEFNLVQQ